MQDSAHINSTLINFTNSFILNDVYNHIPSTLNISVTS